jgi:hypothetical protein
MPTHVISADGVQADPNTGNVAIVQTVYSLKTILTDAQIKALPTTPVELVPAQGAEKGLFIHSAFFRSKFTGGAYTNIDASYCDLSLYPTYLPMFAKDIDASLNNIFFANPDTENFNLSGQFQFLNNYFLGAAVDESVFNNHNITLRCTNPAGNFTGGNAANTLEVTVFYSIVDL